MLPPPPSPATGSKTQGCTDSTSPEPPGFQRPHNSKSTSAPSLQAARSPRCPHGAQTPPAARSAPSSTPQHPNTPRITPAHPTAPQPAHPTITNPPGAKEEGSQPVRGEKKIKKKIKETNKPRPSTTAGRARRAAPRLFGCRRAGNTCRQPAALPRSRPARRAAVHKGLRFSSPRSYIFPPSPTRP